MKNTDKSEEMQKRDRGVPASSVARSPAFGGARVYLPSAAPASHRLVKGDQGFTLIEVLVAVVILTVGLLAVGTMQISAIRGNFMSGNTSIALSLASERMEDILNSSFNDPTGQPPKLTDQTTGNNSNLSSITTVDYEEQVSEDGVVGAGGFYRRIWNIANVPSVAPTTKNVVVIVTWESNRHRVSIASVKNQVIY